VVGRDGLRGNSLLRGEGGEQFLHDIVLVQLGLNVLKGDIAKSRQADLNKEGIGDGTTRKRC